MTFGIVILRIHGVRHSHNRLNRDALHLLGLLIQPALQILAVPIQFNAALNTAHHNLRFKRFGNKVKSSHPETFDFRLHTTVSRQKDNRNLTPALIRL